MQLMIEFVERSILIKLRYITCSTTFYVTRYRNCPFYCGTILGHGFGTPRQSSLRIISTSRWRVICNSYPHSLIRKLSIQKITPVNQRQNTRTILPVTTTKRIIVISTFSSFYPHDVNRRDVVHCVRILRNVLF